MNKSISVVVPAYNSERTISKCLEVLAHQTLSPLEIIVVDDGSTDETSEIAKKWAIVIPNTRKKGAGGARNTGAYAAKGDIIAFIDSDCIPQGNWLENIASVFAGETVGAVGGGYSSGIDNGFWQRFCFEELAFRRKGRNGDVNTLVSNNLACRRSVFWEEGGFPEDYPVCEDMLLSYRISRKNKVLWLNDNGIQHHFKDSLKTFLKHQYFFGAESTRFFLQNPKLLFVDNHQGKRLYFAIMLTILSILTALLAPVSMSFKDYTMGGIFFGILIILLISHFLLYFGFIQHLSSVRFHNIPRAYGVSLLRDLVCGISVLDGIFRAFVTRRNNR